MRRMAVLGCLSVLVAGCGGGSGVQGRMETGPGEPGLPPAETRAGPTLETLGAYETVPIDDAGSASTARFHRWGVWGGMLRDDRVTCTAIGCPPPGDTIFMAYISQGTGGGTAVEGMRSGTSPAMGSAVWSGDVRAYETGDVVDTKGASVTTYAPVEGDARLEVDFSAVTVDVDFTNFDNRRADMSWDRLALDNGVFGNGAAGIEGSFYGADHEGAAGTFARDGLTGVFGALRFSQ